MATEQSSFCVNCGAALVAGARFCGKCGQTLASAAPAAPAAPPAQATAPLPAQTPAVPPQYAAPQQYAPQQYAPQQPLPAYGMPPPVARSGGSGVGVIVAVVVVGLVLILGVGGALAWYFLSARTPQGPPVPVAQLPAPAPGMAPTPVALPLQPVAARAQIPPGPGEAAVLAESKARKPGWDAAVHSHTGDWGEVVTKVGPSWGDWRTGLRFRWNGSRYEWVAEGPIAQIANPGTPAATGGGKGAGAALATAKARFGGYVAKVYNQSGNYQEVLVWVGPPNSEWTHYVHMVWNGSRYVIDDTGILEQSAVAADAGHPFDYEVQPEDQDQADWEEYQDNGGDSEDWGGDVEPNGGEDSGGPWEGNPDENPGGWEGDPSEDPYAVG